MQFQDVLDLVPKSTVKVNDVSVGQVETITLDGYTAEVDARAAQRHQAARQRDRRDPPDQPARREVRLAVARPRPAPSDDPLGDGDVIPLERTGRNPEVEEVLGALSLILNGGGVAQLKTIAQELNKASAAARTPPARCSTRSTPSPPSLDTNKADIVNAIEALNRLSLAAHQQEPTSTRRWRSCRAR